MADVQQVAQDQPDIQQVIEIHPLDQAIGLHLGLHLIEPDQAGRVDIDLQQMAVIRAENLHIEEMHPPGVVPEHLLAPLHPPGQARQMRPGPDPHQRGEIHPINRRNLRLTAQDDEDEYDTTELQAKRGRDIQGILWHGLFQRKHYREQRVAQYRNYENLGRSHDSIIREARKFKKGEKFYKFHFNKRSVQPTYMHFQLRNLVWATSKHDVYTFQNSSAIHYSSMTQKTTEVLNLSGPEPTVGFGNGAGGAGAIAVGLFQAMFPPVLLPPLHPQVGPLFPPRRPQMGPMRQQLRRARAWYWPQAVRRMQPRLGNAVHGIAPLQMVHGGLILPLHGMHVNLDNQGQMPLGNQQAGGNDPIQMSTIIVKNNLLIAGGFKGEMVVRNLDSKTVAYNGKITYAENAITNAIDIFDNPSGVKRILTSSNDSVVRVYDCNRFALVTKYDFDWPVNHSSVSPDGRTMIAVGDSDEGNVVDLRSDQRIGTLRGHLDYSFASAWHPGGCTFATGNQDTTCRLWDFRKMDSAFAVLKGRMGAIRSIRFSSDGKFMAMAEPADFVHLFDAAGDFRSSQEVDIFGDIAGISFSPDTEALFIGVTDHSYGSLMEFNRIRANTSYLDSYIY